MVVSHILLVLCFLFTFCSVSAIQCHQCSYQNSTTVGQGSEYNGTQGCEDPSKSTGMEMVDCSGQCYARFISIKFDGQFYGSKFIRGCSTDDEGIDCDAFQGCQQEHSTLACIYCCNDANGCNNHADVQEVAENVFKCYECNATLNSGRLISDDIIINQCGWTQSNDVATRPCPSEMCMTLVTPITKGGTSHITRTCVDKTETLNLCQNETLLEKQNYEINCCNGSLCNVGRVPPRQIECWTCEADLTEDGFPADNSSCSQDDFDGTGATLKRCDSDDRSLAGYCTSLWIPSNDGLTKTTVTRECATVPFVNACHDQSGIYHSTGMKVKVDCCTEDGCNTGGPVGGRGVFKPDPTTEPVQQPTKQPQAPLTLETDHTTSVGNDEDGNESAKILSGSLLFYAGVAFLARIFCK